MNEDLINMLDLDNQPPSLVILHTEPELKVYVDQKELLRLLGFDVEKHEFYISKLEDVPDHNDKPDKVVITVRVESDCGVIKYGE